MLHCDLLKPCKKAAIYTASFPESKAPTIAFTQIILVYFAEYLREVLTDCPQVTATPVLPTR